MQPASIANDTTVPNVSPDFLSAIADAYREACGRTT